MKVRVEYLGHIKNLSNRREEELTIAEHSTVAEALNRLALHYGDPFKNAIYEPKSSDVKPNYIVTVNGYLLNQLKGLGTKLKNGDKIAILPIVSGG